MRLSDRFNCDACQARYVGDDLPFLSTVALEGEVILIDLELAKITPRTIPAPHEPDPGYHKRTWGLWRRRRLLEELGRRREGVRIEITRPKPHRRVTPE